MERYTVTVISPWTGSHLQLLMPFDSSRSLRSFAQAVSRRAFRHGSDLAVENLVLRLGREDGPILDVDDVINHAIINPRDEVVFALPKESEMLNQGMSASAVGQFVTLTLPFGENSRTLLNLRRLEQPRGQTLHPTLRSKASRSGSLRRPWQGQTEMSVRYRYFGMVKSYPVRRLYKI